MADTDTLPPEIVAQIQEMATNSGKDPQAILDDVSARAQRYGLDIGSYLSTVKETAAAQKPGADWSYQLRGADPRVARAAINESAGADSDALGFSPNAALASRSLANLGADHDNAVAPVAGPTLGAAAESTVAPFVNAVRHPTASTAAQAGLGALQLSGYGGFNLGGLARAALSQYANGSSTGLGIAQPDQGRIGNLSDFLSQQHESRAGLLDAARQYGVRVGGYGDPNKVLDAMKPSIEVRRQAMLNARDSSGNPVYSPEQANQWAQDETSRFTALVNSEGGAEGIKQKWHDDTVKAVAGTQPGQGTVNESYNTGMGGNIFTPASIAGQQVHMFDSAERMGRAAAAAVPGAARGAADWLTRKPGAAPAAPAPAPRIGAPIAPVPGASTAAAPAASGAYQDAVAAARAGAAKAAPAALAATKPGWLRGAWEGVKDSGAGKLAGKGLGALGGVAGMAMSMPTYLQSARDNMNLYDTAAADPNGEGGTAHDVATGLTGAASLGTQFAGGEYAVPKGLIAGSQGWQAAMKGTELGKATAGLKPLSNASLWRNPIQRAAQAARSFAAPIRAAGQVGARATLGGLARGAGGFASKAAPGLLLGSMAVDAGANAGAAARNLTSGNFWSGGDQTVRDENQAMADNAGWAKRDAGAMDYLKGGVGGVLRPTSTVREIAGAVDQGRDANRNAEEGAAQIESSQQIAPLQRLQKYRAAIAARGENTQAIDKQIQATSQSISRGPELDAWKDVAKWQQGSTWGGMGTQRAQLPFKEQYARMDPATRARADQIIQGVANGTVDPERARVTLGLPAMQNWSSNDMRDSNKALANQRWVANQADVGTGRANPQWQVTGQWQNPNTAAAPSTTTPKPNAMPAPTTPKPAPLPTAMPQAPGAAPKPMSAPAAPAAPTAPKKP